MIQPKARRPARVFAALAVAALSMQACASKGYVRKQVALAQDTARMNIAAARDSAIASAALTRSSADSAMERRLRTRMDSVDAQVAGLRADITSLRTDFNTRVAVMEDSIKFYMPVHFAFNDTTVREADKPALQKFANIAKHYYPNARITIEGFADPAGSTSYNAALSRRRAEAVQSSLVAMGLTGSNLMTVGYGESRLLSPGASKDQPGAELNRRVVFAIETVGSPISTAMLLNER